MRGGTASSHKEGALSEVIGFVLILGIITAAFSLYLVYGVPAQGRENEINHMNDVKDQFVTYKIGLDALWVNHQTSTTVSNSFTLGTGGGYTQGSNSIIPILSPVSSSGVIGINQRAVENLTITSQSLILKSNQTPIAFTPNNQPPSGNPSPPSNLTVYIDTRSSVTLSDLSVPYGLDLNATQPGGTNWEAVINLTPRFISYNTTQSVNCPPSGGACTVVYSSGTKYTQTDLTITVFKGGVKTLDGAIIYSNVQNTPGNYSVNVMDDAYGLKSTIGTMNLTVTASNTSSPLAARSGGAITYLYQNTLFNYSPITMGSLEYQAQNNYWISQTYYYQLGGIFLYQPTENGTVVKLPPDISFSYANDKKIVTVNINALAIDQTSTGLVGGNSPVQIKTTLTNQTALPYVQGLPANSRWINITVTTPDPAAQAMWRNYFTTTAQAAGIPNYLSPVTSGNDTTIQINGYDTTLNSYDVNVLAQNATYAVRVQGVGGTVQ